MRNRSTIWTRAGPLYFTRRIGFLLPNGHAGLYGVDQITVGVKGGIAMSRRCQSHHSTLADF